MKILKTPSNRDVWQGLGLFGSLVLAGLSLWLGVLAAVAGAYIFALAYFPRLTLTATGIFLVIRVPAIGAVLIAVMAAFFAWTYWPWRQRSGEDLRRYEEWQAKRKINRERKQRIKELREQGFEGYEDR
jgi:type VI protein secretion system component VasK